MEAKRCVYVLSETDGAKYKLVMQGDVQLLTTKKIKRYLEKATGIHAKDLHVRFNDLDIGDNMSGSDMGLYDGAILQLWHPPATSSLTARRDPNAQGSSLKVRSSVGKLADTPPSHREPSAAAPSLPSRQLTTPRETRGCGTREMQLSPAAAPSPYTSVPAGQTQRATSEADRGLRDTRNPSLSMPRTVVQGALHPYGEEPTSRQASTSRSAEDSTHVRSAPRATTHSAAASVEEMEDELEAMREENETLRDMLYAAERRAAMASSSMTSHPDEGDQLTIRDLRSQLAQAHEAIEAARQEAAEVAAAHFEEKERDMLTEMSRLRQELQQVKRERARTEESQRSVVDALRAELQATQAELRAAADAESAPAPPTAYPVAGASVDHLAEAALQSLAKELAVDAIQLDESNTAVVPLDPEVNLLVTLDPASSRLFLYATLLSELPESSAKRLKLYEAVLDGALLGKDMAGASVGISKESNLVLMSTWIDVRYCHPAAFTAMTQPFCDAVRYWIALAEDIAYT